MCWTSQEPQFKNGTNLISRNEMRKIQLKLTELQYDELDYSFEGLREWIDDDSYSDEERKGLKEMLFAFGDCEAKRKHYIINITIDGLEALEGRMNDICERVGTRYGLGLVGVWRSMSKLWDKIGREITKYKNEHSADTVIYEGRCIVDEGRAYFVKPNGERQYLNRETIRVGNRTRTQLTYPKQ